MDNLSQPPAHPPEPFQPYGTASATSGPLRKFRFLAFGIPYAVVNACVVGFMLIAVLVFSSGFEKGMKADLHEVMQTMVVAMVVTILVWSAVSALASVFCISGRVLGWWIGIVHSALAVLFFIVVIAYAVAMGDAEATRIAEPLVLLLAYTGLFALALFDRGRCQAHRDAEQAVEVPAQRPQTSPASTSPAAPATPRKQMVALPAKSRRPENSEVMQDAIQLIAAAASTEPDLAAQRLARASEAVAQLLGPGADAIARQWLDKPMQVDDFESVLELLAPGVARNPRLAQVVIKSVLYAVQDESKQTSPEAAQLVQSLRSRLLGG